MKGGEPLSASFGTVVIILLIIWMCSDVQGPCTEMSIAAMRGGQNERTNQKNGFLGSMEQIKDLKEFYNNEVKKNSYFKIGNFEQDGTIKSNVIDGKEYFMKVKFSSKYSKTDVQIDEIVCINKDEKDNMTKENKNISGQLVEQILGMCPKLKI